MYKLFRLLFVSFLLLLCTQTTFAGRYYDSTTGRWLSVDPLGSKYPGWSPYNYTANNPLNNIDLTGMDWYSQTDSNGAVTYHYNRNLNSDNASKILRDGQAYVGATAFVYGTNGYTFLGNFGKPYSAWRDGWGYSYYQDDFGMINQFISGEMILESLKMAFMAEAGKVLSLFKFGSNATQSSSRVIKGFSGHAANQAVTRGFRTSDILKIIRGGKAIQSMGRYGPQTRYTLGANTVIINAQGKVVTVFSNAVGTAKGLFIPFN